MTHQAGRAVTEEAVTHREVAKEAVAQQASEPIIQLWQAEWCPSSRTVRQRLTELGVDCLLRQVPVEQEQRTALLQVAGCSTIPVLLSQEGECMVGEEQILSWLDQRFPQPDGAQEHKEKAQKALRRLIDQQLEKEAS